ncbi:MAG: hypothetical protein NUV57_04930 [archaeon]|nr:hypothetical protein [archaeon]
MFSAFSSGFTEIIKKPSYLIPAFFGTLANAIVLILSIDSYFNILYSALILGETPDSTLIELPYHLFAFYGTDLIIIGLASFITFGIGIYLVFVYASLLNGKEKSAINAVIKTIPKAKEVFLLAFFVTIAGLLYGFVAYMLFVISLTIEVLGIVTFLLMLAWMIIGILAFLKLAFTPVAMALDNQKLKPALKATWQWSKKRTIRIVIFLFLLSFISGLIGSLFAGIGETVGIEELGVLILILGMIFANAYYNIAFIKFYLNHKQ